MHFKSLVLAFLLLPMATWLWAQMTPNAPVRDFRMPRFSEDGFTQWVLTGGTGIYDSEEQVRVEAMALRVYSGDARLAKELSMESPAATLRILENRAFSDTSIRIEGENFEISGVGWTWDGTNKLIEVLSEVEVKFEQGFNAALSGKPQKGGMTTNIRSDRLLLETTKEAYFFTFTDRVRVASGTMTLQSEFLYSEADAPEGRGVDGSDTGLGKLNAIRKLEAKREVIIQDEGRIVRSQVAEFFPREQKAVLSGGAEIELESAYLSGDRIESVDGLLTLTGSPTNGRSQMILYETGGLGIGGDAAMASETIALADSIVLKEMVDTNQFDFSGSVEVLSGSIQLESDNLVILTRKAAQEAANTGSGKGVELGAVKTMVAEGVVKVRKLDQIATAERVEFFPSEQRALLTGSPRISSQEAVVDGQRMDLVVNGAEIFGSESEPLVVSLPAIPNLGFDPNSELESDPVEVTPEPSLKVGPEPSPEVATLTSPEASEGATDGVEATAETVSEPVEIVDRKTVIRSEYLKMTEMNAGSLFEFKGSVEVLATNLIANCERMEVFTKDGSDPEGVTGLDRIVAYDSIRVEQLGRVAKADKLTILPEEGKLLLEGSAEVADGRGTVTGEKLTLFRGERRALIEGGQDGKRAKITLPSFPQSTE